MAVPKPGSLDSLVKDYFNPSKPGSFAGVTTFVGQRRGAKELDQVLRDFPAYSLHKPVRKRFPRNKTIVGNIDSLWQMDLSVMTQFEKYNNGCNYILCVIDVLSKFAFAEAMKRKRPEDVRDALSRIFARTERRPTNIQTDNGMEFRGKNFQTYLKTMNIGYYHSNNEETKASVVERFQKTLKSKMWRYFRHNNTWRFVDVLQPLLDSYNATYNRAIGRPPNEVNLSNAPEVWRRLFDSDDTPRSEYKFQVGDHVRMTSGRSLFRKGYESGWTEEIFRIVTRHPRQPPVYSIEDLLGEKISGTVYEWEIQKVNLKDDYFVVDKVIKTRRRGNKREYLVSYRGWPPKFNQWVKSIRQI